MAEAFPVVGAELAGALSALREVIPTLEFLTQEVDGRFGALGDVTAALATANRTLTERSDAFATAIRDKEGLVLAYQVFKKARDVVEANLEQTLLAEAELHRVEDLLLQSERGEDAFHRHLSVFRYLGTAIRIEGSRLSQVDRTAISTLVATLTQLHQDVQTIVTSQFSDLHAIRAVVSTVRDKLAGERSLSNARVSRFVDTMKTTFDALDAAFDLAGKYQTECGSLHSGTKASFREIVVALQSQDIVRQKLESIVKGISTILDAPAEGRHLALINALAQIEVRQLGDAEAEIVSAEERAKRNVESFLATCEHGLSATSAAKVNVRESLAHSSTTARLLAAQDELEAVVVITSSIATEVSQVVQQVQARVLRHATELSLVLYRLRLIALNAQIRAAKVSSRTALEVLAATTKDTSENMHQSSSGLLDVVRMLAESLEVLDKGLREMQAISTRERETLRTEGSSVQEGLRKIEQSLDETFGALEKSLALMRYNVRNAIADLSAKRDLRGSFEHLREVFERLVDLTRQVASDPAHSSYVAGRLADLRTGYVMHDQRVVHDDGVAALGSNPRPLPDAAAPNEGGEPGPEPATSPPGKDDEPAKEGEGLGDNIELF